MHGHTSSGPLDIHEMVVNWHLLEACNYRCGFCYAAWDTPRGAPGLWRDPVRSAALLEELRGFFDPANAENPLRDRLRWNSLRLSLAGGEPTLIGDRLVEIAADARRLGFRVSLISNGSRLGGDRIAALAPCLDMLGISIDSADPDTNIRIGRCDGSGTPLLPEHLVSLVGRARAANPALAVKVNTVVSAGNADESLADIIARIRPDRWKLLRVLPMVSEALSIGKSEFDAFVGRHRQFSSIISVEDNAAMTESYVMVDPQGRFFQNRRGLGGYAYSLPILHAGAARAFEDISVSPERFAGRYRSTASAT